MAEKIKYEIEYTFKTSPKILFSRLSTPSGLSEWFAKDVKVQKENLTFVWDGYEETAQILEKKDQEHIKFQWLDNDDDSYFEFRIKKDALTHDLALIITDFADDENEKEDDIELWDTQINELKRVLGL